MSNSSVYNFSAGPSMLPQAVMKRAQEEFLNWQGTGSSVAEVSHRGKEFIAMAEQAESDLRALLQIPDNYTVLYMTGGATGQFSFVPMNLLGEQHGMDYVYSGQWSEKAIKAAKKYGEVNVVAKIAADGAIPPVASWALNKEAAYVHITSNETIDGIEFHETPEVGDVPLVADMSSNILSRPIDVSKYGLIYAGTQKNIAMAGLTLVIVRNDLMGKAAAFTPDIFNYQAQAKAESMLNTPPTYVWYMAGLTYRWLLDEGGLATIAERNDRKAAKLYQFIDNSSLYSNAVNPHSRSRMNVPFTLPEEALNQRFLKKADAEGLVYLKGHRLVGGMRASIYNAMPEAGVDALIDFMRDFEQHHA